MSLRRIVTKYANDEDIEVVCKSTMNYIKNALSVFDVSISDFNALQVRSEYGYEINSELENILKTYIPKMDFPKKSQINKSKLEKSSLTVEVVKVAKNFIEANFNDSNYCALREKVDKQIEEVGCRFQDLSKMYKGYADSIEKNRLSYMFTHTILEQKLQSIFKINLSYDMDNYTFEDIIDLIHMSKQLRDIIKILNRSKSIQDIYKTISVCI